MLANHKIRSESLSPMTVFEPATVVAWPLFSFSLISACVSAKLSCRPCSANDRPMEDEVEHSVVVISEVVLRMDD